MWVRSLSREDSLEEEMAAHSSILAWEISWTEEPARLQSTGSRRVGHEELDTTEPQYYLYRINSTFFECPVF